MHMGTIHHVTLYYTPRVFFWEEFVVRDYAFNKGLPAVFSYRTLQKVSMY